MINVQEDRLPLKDLEMLMLDRLRAVAERVYENVPMYRRKFDEAGVKPKHLATLKDLKKFPFTTKADLRDDYPLGTLTVPMEKLTRIHATAGITGKPIFAGYTKKDIETWAEIMGRALVIAGVHEGDVIQNAFGYGMPTTGLGVHYGAERIGIVVIPASEARAKQQLLLLEDLKSSVLCCTPSVALQIGVSMREMGVLKQNLKLRIGIFGGEPWSENMRAELEDMLGVLSIDLYGLSEMMGPGVACECFESRAGAHIFMDHFLPEIINPVTGETLPHGEKGELVLTSLTKDAFPLIRYRTRDISQLNTEPCRCGRTMWRMSRVMGRTDDLLTINGVKVFPSQIEAVLLRYSEVEPHYIIEMDRENAFDSISVTAEVSALAYTSKGTSLEPLEKRIGADMLDSLGITVKVKLVAPNTLRRADAKSRRVVDKRNI